MRDRFPAQKIGRAAPFLLYLLLQTALLQTMGGCAGASHKAAGAPAPGSPAESPAFAGVAEQMGIRYLANRATRRPRDILETNGSGAAWLDYDGDGRLDLLLVGRPRCALYRNEGERFRDVTQAAGLDAKGFWIGAGAADFDNDGRTDLCLTGYRCGALLRNEGGRFRDVSAASGIRFPGWGQSVAWGDIDNDGLLDLYLGAYVEYGPKSQRYCPHGKVLAVCGPEIYPAEQGRLYRALGKGRFQPAGDEARGHGRTWGAMFQDFNDDGRTDLYIANDMTPCDLLLNEGNGRMRNIGTRSGTAYDGNGGVIAGMAVDWADYDGDERPDLLVTNFEASPTLIFRNLGQQRFSEESGTAGLIGPTSPYVGFGGRFIDYDNDGWRDLLLANGHVHDNALEVNSISDYRQPALLLRNQEGTYVDRSSLLGGLKPLAGRGAAFGDFDDDGRIDVLICDMEENPVLLRGMAKGGSWVGLRLRGVRSNRDGIGARVWVKSAATQHRQRLECQTSGSLLSSNDPRLLFGLGAAEAAAEVEIRWPSGAVSRLKDLPAGRYHTVTEPAGP